MKKIGLLIIAGFIVIFVTGCASIYSQKPEGTVAIGALTNTSCVPLVLKHDPSAKIINILCFYGD